jgi:hypothetical protein
MNEKRVPLSTEDKQEGPPMRWAFLQSEELEAKS